MNEDMIKCWAMNIKEFAIENGWLMEDVLTKKGTPARMHLLISYPDKLSGARIICDLIIPDVQPKALDIIATNYMNFMKEQKGQYALIIQAVKMALLQKGIGFNIEETADGCKLQLTHRIFYDGYSEDRFGTALFTIMQTNLLCLYLIQTLAGVVEYIPEQPKQSDIERNKGRFEQRQPQEETVVENKGSGRKRFQNRQGDEQ